jgi:hypothetical protein
VQSTLEGCHGNGFPCPLISSAVSEGTKTLSEIEAALEAVDALVAPVALEATREEALGYLSSAAAEIEASLFWVAEAQRLEEAEPYLSDAIQHTEAALAFLDLADNLVPSVESPPGDDL